MSNISIEKTKNQLKIKTGKLSVLEALQTLFHTQLALLNAAVDAVPPEKKEIVKADLYEIYNIGASNTLAIFAPEIEMRPDLTVQAILEKENEILNRQ